MTSLCLKWVNKTLSSPDGANLSYQMSHKTRCYNKAQNSTGTQSSIELHWPDKNDRVPIQSPSNVHQVACPINFTLNKLSSLGNFRTINYIQINSPSIASPVMKGMIGLMGKRGENHKPKNHFNWNFFTKCWTSH